MRFEDFREGDRIHDDISGDNGTIRLIKDGAVYVIWDALTRHGEQQRTIFGRSWFNANPNILAKIT